MKIFSRHVVYLIAFCAILAIAGFCAETGFPEKTSAASTPDPIASSATTAETVEETVTLSASDIKTWAHGYSWREKHWYCDPSFHIESVPDDVPGSMMVGYHHFWDAGKPVLGCPEKAGVTTRGTVSFDLSSIASKAPPLHVSVTRALLHYKMDKGCDNHQLLIAQEDWLKGYPEDKLVPGDLIADIPASCASEGKGPRSVFLVCAPEDVARVLNNWLRGEGNGGFANYGFAFAGIVEEDMAPNNDACWTRFSDFSLTVTYKYDKAPVRPKIGGNPGMDSRKNVALASNGGVATASSTHAGQSPSFANDGDRKGLNYGWSAVSATFPQWLQIDFKGSKTIDEIDVFATQDNYMSPSEPTESMTFSLYGLSGYDVQYWDGSSWVTVMPGGSVTGNNKVWRKFTFASITTAKIRVLTNASADGRSHVMELEAWGK